MQLEILKSKILRAELTDAQLHYEGSLAIDRDLMDRVGILPYEKILIGNITNGERLETYAIPAPRGSLTFSLNGAAAHKGARGHLIVIMAFAQMSTAEAQQWEPRVLTLGNHNREIVLERGPDHPNATPHLLGI